ncbi:DUF5810 domain-containing protein [Natronobeatus ordinarius]|uniref:DUF5810 domain-containing protein n=1 Tax=Natronobeatus ordinarius TaxID=2963433 RepID=UPI0020CFC4AA|nr:DUF5810 domain-containing protein [Natronobeatus ordinarius]
MGYACPVCGAAQADEVHLANHLGVTASLGREDHLEWLAEYAPDWADCGPDELAAQVVEHAPEVDTPELEDEDGHADAPPLEAELARQTRLPGRGELTTPEASTAETERVLEEARELTRRMHESAAGSDEDENA